MSYYMGYIWITSIKEEKKQGNNVFHEGDTVYIEGRKRRKRRK